MQPLTNAELTQGFLLHEEQLALLQLQTSLVYKLPMDGLLSGKAHPHGSCSHFTAGALLVQLGHSKQRPPGVDVETAFGNMVSDLGDEPHVQLVSPEKLGKKRPVAFLAKHAAKPAERSGAKGLLARLARGHGLLTRSLPQRSLFPLPLRDSHTLFVSLGLNV